MKQKEKIQTLQDLNYKQQKLSTIDSLNYNHPKRNSQGFISLQSKIDNLQSNLILDQTNYDIIQQRTQEDLIQLDYQNKYDPVNIDPSKYKKLNFLESYKQIISSNMAKTLDSTQIRSKNVKNEGQAYNQIQKGFTYEDNTYNQDNIKILNSQLRKINTNSSINPSDNNINSAYNSSTQENKQKTRSVSGYRADQRNRSKTKPELIVINPTKEEVNQKQAQLRERQIQHNNIQINQLLYPQDQYYIQENTFLKTEGIQQQNKQFEEEQAKRIMKNIERFQNQVLKPSNCARSKLVPKMIQDRTLRLFSSNTPSQQNELQRMNLGQQQNSNPIQNYFTSHLEEQQNALEQLGYPISYRKKPHSNQSKQQEDYILPDNSNTSNTMNFSANNIYHKNINKIPNNNQSIENKQSISFDIKLSYKEYQDNYNMYQEQEQPNGKASNIIKGQPQSDRQQRSIPQVDYNSQDEYDDEEEAENPKLIENKKREMELILQQHFNQKKDKQHKKLSALILPDITSPYREGIKVKERNNSVIKSTRSQSVASKSYQNNNSLNQGKGNYLKRLSRAGSPFNKKCNDQCDNIYKQCCDLMEI